KSIDDFAQKKRSPDGRNGTCKECINAQEQERTRLSRTAFEAITADGTHQKKCRTCEQWLPLTNFLHDRKACRACENERKAQYSRRTAQRRAELLRAANSRYRERHKETIPRRSRENKLAQKYGLTLEDYEGM